MKFYVKVTQLMELNSYEKALEYKNGLDNPLAIGESNKIFKEVYDYPIKLKEMKTEIVRTPEVIIYEDMIKKGEL